VRPVRQKLLVLQVFLVHRWVRQGQLGLLVLVGPRNQVLLKNQCLLGVLGTQWVLQILVVPVLQLVLDYQQVPAAQLHQMVLEILEVQLVLGSPGSQGFLAVLVGQGLPVVLQVQADQDFLRIQVDLMALVLHFDLEYRVIRGCRVSQKDQEHL
jgi:hypothetical protein